MKTKTIVAATLASGAQAEDINTRIGKLTFENGIPSSESMAKLYDEMDFQRATQAYIWATPAVYFNEWAYKMQKELGVGYGDVAIWDNCSDPRTSAFIVGVQIQKFKGANLEIAFDMGNFPAASCVAAPTRSPCRGQV